MKDKPEILPQVEKVLSFIESIDVSHIQEPVFAFREFYERFIPLSGEAEQVYAIENTALQLAGRKIGIRIYRPNAQKDLPAVIYFHGGWFSAGSLESHDRPLRSLANLSGAAIISVDYRLAPEHPFPNGFQDCYDVTAWIINNAATLNIDGHRVAIAGDSAGGALAAAVVNKLKSPDILCQILIYPVTDSSLTSLSWSDFADGPVLSLPGAIEAWEQYATTTAHKTDASAAPLLETNLSGVPFTLIIEAEYDPLRDEAIHYATKLRSAHVQVTETLYPKMIHGFFQMGGFIDQGQDAIRETARFIRHKLKI